MTVKHVLKISLSIVCALGSLSSHAQIIDDPRMFSFEDKAELSHIQTQNSSVALSNTHFKNGKKSLEWNFKRNGILSIKKDLQFEPHEKGNRDNYLSAFIVWVYNEKPMTDKPAEFQFLKNGKVCTSFPMNLDFKGWRGAWVCYERDMKGKPQVGMDEIKIIAPDTAGELWIDHLITAIKVDPRQQTADFQVPFVNKNTTNHWLIVMQNYFTKPDLPLTDITANEKADIRKIEDKFRSLVYTPAKLYPKQMEEMRAQIKKYNIKRKNNIVTGEGIWFVRHAEAYERMVPDWEKNMLTRTGFEMNDYFLLMERIARGYNNATAVEDMDELKEMFLLMYDHITDQGVAFGSCWGNIHHYGYSLRSMYIAYFLMKDVLKQANKLEEAVQTMIWYSQLNELYAKPTGNGIDTDTFNTASIGCTASILLMDDSPEKWRYLRSCSRWLDWGCRPAPGLSDAFKIDGSAYHHCNNYPAYAVGGLNGATQMIYVLSGTQLAVSQLAHTTVKNAMLAMRFYCNLTHFPLALSGRHPNGTGHLTPIHYAYMAMAGTPDNKEDFDIDMASAFMRLLVKPTSTVEKRIFAEFQQRGITPEKDPQGNLSLGYACTAVQRRSNWSAVVRGQSRYLWGAEHYVNENRFGRYLGYGSLQVSTAPQGTPVTPATSGWVQQGFDWNRIPGVTSLHLPLDELEAKIRNVDIASGVEEMLISDEAFAGGLSQLGANGNFGLKLHEHDKYNGTFRARKSYHFFDNVIVCLGSDIEEGIGNHNTETTIFQMAVTDETAKKYWDSYLPVRNTWLDHLHTGYYTPDKTTFTGLINQKSRTEDWGKDTEGQWVTLYIDHGKAPKGGTYEYAILPQTNNETLSAFAESPTYHVVQQDRNAHIVRSSATNTLSYVIFEKPEAILPGGPLLHTDTTCLAMVKMVNSKKMILTVAQPDLALYRGNSDDIYVNGKRAERSIYGRKWRDDPSLEIPVVVTLLGKWSFKPQDNIQLVSQTEKTTIIRFVCKDGLSYNIELNK